MSVTIVRLGNPRLAGEGPRFGTVRRPPRGVPKSEFARRDFYDVWLPELAPSGKLVAYALSEPFTQPRWRRYVRAYLAEMRKPAARHLIEALATLSHHTNFSVGCYCVEESRCHRGLLRALLVAAGADVASHRGSARSR